MRRPSPTFIALLFFIVLDSFVFYGTYIERNIAREPVTLSASAPDVAWKDFDGHEHDLKEFAGHVVVLHFWAAWCPPCREEFPKLLKTAGADKDIIFLTVSSDDTREKPEQFIKMAIALSGIKAPPNVFYAWDPDRKITYDQFLTDRYPESIVIDPKYRLRRKFPTPVNWESSEIHDYLNDLKNDKEPEEEK